jgi:hypothetical protein
MITNDVDSNESENKMNAIDWIRNIHNEIVLKRLNLARRNANPNRLNTLNSVVIKHNVPASNWPFCQRHRRL